jgi:hypothetical protein
MIIFYLLKVHWITDVRQTEIDYSEDLGINGILILKMELTEIEWEVVELVSSGLG